MRCFCTLLIPIPCSCTPKKKPSQNPATSIPIPISPHPHPRLQAALRRHLVAAGAACTPASPVPPPAPPVPLLGWDAALPAPLDVRLAPPKTCSTGLRAPCALACAHQQLCFGEKLGKGEGENPFFVFF